jgi:hypothetical protein
MSTHEEPDPRTLAGRIAYAGLLAVLDVVASMAVQIAPDLALDVPREGIKTIHALASQPFGVVSACLRTLTREEIPPGLHEAVDELLADPPDWTEAPSQSVAEAARQQILKRLARCAVFAEGPAPRSADVFAWIRAVGYLEALEERAEAAELPEDAGLQDPLGRALLDTAERLFLLWAGWRRRGSRSADLWGPSAEPQVAVPRVEAVALLRAP